MRLTWRQLRNRLGPEDGFTMAAVMGVMLVVMLLSVAAITVANGDTHLSRADQDNKQAYATAEAGLNDYLAHLNTDSNYWASCTNVAAPTPVNQKGATGVSREWRTLPGTTSRYSIELLPASGSTCSTTSPTSTMVDSDGNIKVRVTGNVIGTNRYRTIVGTFRRAGFLDFLYYTDYENQDPAYMWRNLGLSTKIVTRASTSNGAAIPGGDDLEQWAGKACNVHWWEGRSNSTDWRGQASDGNGGWVPAGSSFTVSTDNVCGEIQFVTGDQVNGPFHSNDNILVCGTPRFGNNGGDDRVEVSGTGWRSAGGGCNSSPDFNPSLAVNVPEISPPATNSALKDLADDNYTFTGQTTVTLGTNTITVKNPNVNGGATKTMNYPPSGIIYAANNGCTNRYDPLNWDRQDPNCGDVRLQGTYNKDLTIAAENDVIITNSVKQASGTGALLGLIPNGFARIWHPVNQSGSAYSSCSNSGSPTNVQVDAAILTLTGSFTVDNYWCGGSLGTLTVNGAIAQTHRGVVGTGSGDNGYLKNYNYNTDFHYRSPPHFLDPLQTSWRILRQGEQSPAASG